MFRNPTTDLIVVLVIVLLILGPKRLPGLGRSLGQGMKEFKEGITNDSRETDAADRPELTQAVETGTATAAADPQPVAGARESADVGSERTS
jgi:sec-independent protein translocase protein TatA